ncbi:alpha/beta hydrolase [Streptomyces sp. NBC_01463]|uniref:alpha/beta fold hydrolase n=1 Tax=Streptomyces sp. RTGN2 TaxID=3016525 RepID=UPI0025539349|nr:alpha/beta fold hydrolase [Streptomyces sp. RTGN2]
MTTTRPKLLLVHGIGGPRDVEEERHTWTRALAEGARAAGHADAISALTMGWSVETDFVHYADLFTRGGAQGPSTTELDDDVAELTLAVAVDVIDALLAMPEHAGDALLLRLRVQAAPAPVNEDGTPKNPEGTGALVRRASAVCAKLARVPGVQLAVQRVSSAQCLGMLSQPGRYLRRKEHAELPQGRGASLDERVRARVLDKLDPERPAIVIGHSLGSVIAWESLAAYSGPVALFVTLGSPLAMNALIWQRLRPQPPAVPETVERWVDVWDGDDPVAPRRRSAEVVAPNAAGVRPEPVPVDSRLLWTHSALTYLRRREVAGPVMEAVLRLSTTS